MVASTLKTTEERKKAQAKRLSKRMGEIRVTYQPDVTLNVNAGDNEADPTSKGHAFEIDGAECGEFPSFGFSALVDDRHNGGDLAQSVVDELFAIANAYLEVARRNARRLNREPKPITFRWEDLVTEIDWEEEERHEAWERSRPTLEDNPRTPDANEPGRVRRVLPNGDLVIDGTGLYRVVANGEVQNELLTKREAERFAHSYNGCMRNNSAVLVSYSELASKAESVA